MTMLLEVIACSVTDALEAERGGAGRLELVRELGRGGLTPLHDFVQDVREAVTIPIRVMLREADGYEAGGADAVERLASLAIRFAALGVDGMVLGFLYSRHIDVAAMDTVLAAASPGPATFHHAFDELSDPIAALREFGRWPRIDRVLTAGGAGDWNRKAARLDRLVEAAGPKVTILAGGGVDVEALRVLSQSSIVEAHVGRAARVPPTVDGAVSSNKVAELVEAARR
jgi:copper homeostasis protein